MTKEETLEYVKCRKDPVYFIRKYAKIRHPTKGLIHFLLWDFQEDALNDFLNHSYNVILKARQLGLSTLCSAYIAWMVTFFKEREVYIIATKMETATNMVTKVKVVIEYLPDWMRSDLSINNRQSIEMNNGSKVKASASTPDAARSEALSLLVIDEAAFVREMDEIWVAAQPTLSTGGDCIALSTPNGVGNWFHKTYTEAETGKSMEVSGHEKHWNAIKFHWSLHPDRDEKWADYMKGKLSARAWAQEHECDFLQSGMNVISYEDLNWYNKNPTEETEHDITRRPYIRKPLAKEYMDHNVWIWDYPQPGRRYMMSCDVARGDGTDHSTFQIIDVEKYEQVAEYKGQIATNLFSHLIVQYAHKYNGAYLIVENNGIGHAAVMGVLENDYRNIHWTQRDSSKLHTENAYLYANNPWDVPKNAVPGFTTSSRTRPNMIARLEEDIRKKEFIFHSQRLFDEFMTYVFENGKPTHMKGYNDDLIMALAIGMYVRYNDITLFGHAGAYDGQMINGMSQSSKPFDMGIMSNDSNKKRTDVNYTFMTLNGKKEDLRWLI